MKKKARLDLIFQDIAGVPADGRCLFRAVSYGACLKSAEKLPDENRQRELADDLRAQVHIFVESAIFYFTHYEIA